MRCSIQFQDSAIPAEIDDDLAGSTTLVFAHGAGGSMDHKTTLWLTELLRTQGLRIVRFNFPYRADGKSVPDRMPRSWGRIAR